MNTQILKHKFGVYWDNNTGAIGSGVRVSSKNYNAVELTIKATTSINIGLDVNSQLDGDLNGTLRAYEKGSGKWLFEAGKTIALEAGVELIVIVDCSSWNDFGFSKSSGTCSISYRLMDSFRLPTNIYKTYWDGQISAIGSGDTFDVTKYNTIKLYINSDSDELIKVQGVNFDGVSVNGFSRAVNTTLGSKMRGDLEEYIKCGFTQIVIDCSDLVNIGIGKSTSNGSTNLSFSLLESQMSDFEKKILLSDLKVNGIVNLFDSEYFSISKWDNESYPTLAGVIRDIAVFHDNSKIYVSKSGINGDLKSIIFNDSVFPNLIPSSSIVEIVVMPWTRELVWGDYRNGQDWRMCVITDKGQLYHNFPSRATNGDGVEDSDGLDYVRFEESVAWDLPNRKHPVKTTSGNDAALIATGCYAYYPILKDNLDITLSPYTLHPGVDVVSPYGNLGFGSTITKTDNESGTYKASRFYQMDRSNPNKNSFYFFGGIARNEKMTLLGTYRTNSSDNGCRMVVFATDDGGRNWYARYEFGGGEQTLRANDTIITNGYDGKGSRLDSTSLPDVGAGVYKLKKRSSYNPSSINKEPELTMKFKYGSDLNVLSIASGFPTVVTTTTDHGLNDGDAILFDSVTPNASWDWIVNTGYDSMNSGSEFIFKVKKIDSTSFELYEYYGNKDNPISCRHIHSINRNKDNYIIGTGEQYPRGWIIHLEAIEADEFARKRAFDVFNFTRLTSLDGSVQRPLGVITIDDPDNNYLVGSDNEFTTRTPAELPSGRSGTITKASQGVFKGRLIDIDNNSLFVSVFESKEVCFFFKKIEGALIYVGQFGHVGISFDNGDVWSEYKLPSNAAIRHFRGVTSKKEIVIDNHIIKLKI